MDEPVMSKHVDPQGDAAALGAAWDQFYAHCARIIAGCPSVRKLSDSDREDCVQEVMVEIVRKFGARQPEELGEGLPGWIRAVSRNKAVDIVRRRYRRPEVAFDDGSGETIPAGGHPLGKPESVGLVWEALVSLDQEVSVTSYLIFYLHKVEGWTIEEVAELFQLAPGTARTRCHRVKEKFDALLRGLEREGPRPH